MPSSRCSLVAVVVAAVLLVSLVAPGVAAASSGHHRTSSDVTSASESEASVLAGLDQSVIDSAAAEIQAQLDLEAEANANYQGHARPALEAGSAEAAAFEASAPDAVSSHAQPTPDAFAF